MFPSAVPRVTARENRPRWCSITRVPGAMRALSILRMKSARGEGRAVAVSDAANCERQVQVNKIPKNERMDVRGLC